MKLSDEISRVERKRGRRIEAWPFFADAYEMFETSPAVFRYFSSYTGEFFINWDRPWGRTTCARVEVRDGS